MNEQQLIEGLNPQQQQVVTAPEQPLLVLAGAGSGKTRVLTYRMAWLIQVAQISPYAILAVTFTNKAANEMRGRIEQLLDPHVNMRQMWVGTFHSLSHRLLRLHWERANLPQAFQVIDSDDQLRLLRRIHQQLQLDEARWPVKQSQWYINKQKQNGHRASNITAPSDYFEETMLKVYRQYSEHCERSGVVDFAELLLRSLTLFQENPDLLAHYHHRFKHLLVDEFQDTNAIQYQWLKTLIGPQTVMMAVGDDDQSIYSWRGAKVENLDRFRKDYPNTALIRLEQNYRSTQRILTAANAVIANNTKRLGKALWSEGQGGDPITLYAAFNERDEANFVMNTIKTLRQGDYAYRDIAILYRSNAQSRILEEYCMQQGIPYRVYGGQKFFDRAEIKDALAYLRLIDNRHDDPAFERIINTPTRGIGHTTLEVIRDHARHTGCSLWQSTLAVLENDSLASRAKQAVARFVDLINRMNTSIRDLSLGEQCEHVIVQSGLRALYEKDKSDKDQIRLENLNELVNAAGQFHLEHDDVDIDVDMDASIAAGMNVNMGVDAAGTDASMSEVDVAAGAAGIETNMSVDVGLGASMNADAASIDMGADRHHRNALTLFLTHVALDSGEQHQEMDQDAISLMTLHAAKGLEFPIVFMTGLEEDLFPHKMALDNQYGLEEERRLCYVGMTRAMEKLYMSYAEIRKLHGIDRYNRPSRFIQEIPEDELHCIRPTVTTSRPLRQRSVYAGTSAGSGTNARPGMGSGFSGSRHISAQSTAMPPHDEQPWQIGLNVRHPKFGTGVILNTEGQGSHLRLQVKFVRQGVKWLVAQYARLEVIA